MARSSVSSSSSPITTAARFMTLFRSEAVSQVRGDQGRFLRGHPVRLGRHDQAVLWTVGKTCS
jgi:hypothetical protein